MEYKIKDEYLNKIVEVSIDGGISNFRLNEHLNIRLLELCYKKGFEFVEYIGIEDIYLDEDVDECSWKIIEINE